MAVSGFGVGMAATGAFVAYVAITDQLPADALRSLLKGTVTPVPNTHPTLAGLPTASDASTAAGASGGSSALATAALKYVGRSYQWAHNFDPPNGGGDCSGLVYRAFHDIGYNTPRLSSYQYPVWSAVKKDASPQAGDILWWTGHVAIAVGNGQMVEAPTVGIPVRVVSIRRGGLALTPQLSALQKYAVATSRGQAF
jgi:cell wall-associated NlpC family hydrolase